MTDLPANAREARIFDRNKNEKDMPETLTLVPIVGTGGWPTFLRTENGTYYDYDPQLTQQHDAPCYVQRG